MIKQIFSADLIFLSFFFSALFFLFNVFLIQLLFRKIITSRIIGKNISPWRSDRNKQFFPLVLLCPVMLQSLKENRWIRSWDMALHNFNWSFGPQMKFSVNFFWTFFIDRLCCNMLLSLKQILRANP